MVILKKLLRTGKPGEQGLNNIDFSNTLTFFYLHHYLSVSNMYGQELPAHISSARLTAGSGLHERHCTFHAPHAALFSLRGHSNHIQFSVFKDRTSFYSLSAKSSTNSEIGMHKPWHGFRRKATPGTLWTGWGPTSIPGSHWAPLAATGTAVTVGPLSHSITYRILKSSYKVPGP